ncbi:epimerase [Streptomyces sp. WAC05374]|uniref:NAD(P)-dependent oxidoreductase n=1 Tax=Streptomyces sp. WAC05374 TaxID=2487420 RepID=UPI000F85F086|nr:NAD(P)H-binding protein [Streptomyces sp. WAC05374]RST16230.1 epimerase [Streptomyces sp. WAC05374]TDF40514.1 epimerase [Streptomyces sp. WAC05374]TDF49148.1 epimerase [Streptomyces sp. WAC05374]TDF49634.1 epimerase [Streptomyces sp. WAC05374]
MKLTVFGATGGIGQELVRQGLAAGHHVTAVVRDPARLTVADERLEVAEVAGFDDAASLRAAVAGRHAVLSGLGPRTRKQVGVASALTRPVLRALEAEGTRRFLAVSAAPLGPVPADETLFLRLLTPVVSRVLSAHYDDLRLMEDEMRRSATDWTAVRPPQLLDRPVTGRYRTAVGTGLRGGARIARADVAHAMLAMIDDTATVKQPVAVAY